MRLIRPPDWVNMPWKNGGGTTSEIAIAQDGDAILWRLSTALVERDGPYSRFPDLMRISTAVEGNGTTLRDPASGEVVDIPPLSPTLLDGNIPWEARLTKGSIRHCNLVFDANRIRATARLLHVTGQIDQDLENSILFCISGKVSIADITCNPLDCLLWPQGRMTGDATVLALSIEALR